MSHKKETDDMLKYLEMRVSELIDDVEKYKKTLKALTSALFELCLNHSIEEVALNKYSCDHETHEFMDKITRIIQNISSNASNSEVERLVERQVKQQLAIREALAQKEKKEK